MAGARDVAVPARALEADRVLNGEGAAPPLVLLKLHAVHGGGLSEPVILSDVLETADGKKFTKISSSTSWLCRMITGMAVRYRPLAHVQLFKLIRKAVDDALQQPICGEEDGIAALGFDDPPTVVSKKHHKKRKEPEMEHLVVFVPNRPNGRGTRSLLVLAKSAKECAHIELTEDNLTWLVSYLREEVKMLAQASADAEEPDDLPRQNPEEPADAQDQKEDDGIWWCSTSSCFRFAALVPGTPTPVRVKRNFHVSRNPAETFGERVAAAREEASQVKSALERGEWVEPNTKRKRKRASDADFVGKENAGTLSSCHMDMKTKWQMDESL
jgi:hypothetical protein